MADFSLVLDDQERDYLVSLLQTVLKETEIEEHRTRAPNYRKLVRQQEDVIVGLLTKLGQPTTN
jgi:hypothetical protein